MTRFLVFLLAFGWSISASADSAPDLVQHLGDNGAMYLMCDGEDDASADCLAADGDEIVLDTAGFDSVVIDFTASTATGGFTCDVIGSALGHDASSPTGDGQDLTATQFSEAGGVLVQSLPITPRYIWINCDAQPTGGTLTVHALGRTER